MRHFSLTVLLICMPAPLSAGVVLFGFDETTDQLISIDGSTGAGTAIGPTGLGTIADFAIDSSGQIFASNYAADELISIDRNTGAVTTIGSYGPFANVVGLAFDSVGNLYGIDDGTDQILQINTSTGAASALSTLSITDVSGLTFDATDTLYATDSHAGNLLTLDPNTGSHSIVGSYGVAGGSITSITFDSAGTLYGTDRGATDSLYTISTSTGAATAVGPFGFASVNSIAFDSASVPEPTSAALLAAGGICGLCLRRRRKSED